MTRWTIKTKGRPGALISAKGEWKMENVVKLYKITITKAYMMSEQGTGYSLTPWSGNNVDYEGYDDGGRDYLLPEGYKVGETVDGTIAIFDANDQYCSISAKNNGNPTLVTGSGAEPIFAWGGLREGAGRPATGRKRQQFYVTHEENVKLRKYLEQLRKPSK